MVLKRNVRGGKPSEYPRIPFHGLRTAQLISSITVAGIMSYFMYYLHLEHFSIPWTFIVLMCVSLATIVALAVTIVLYNFTFLSPRFNLILNGGLSLIWAMGLGMLSWSISTSQVLAKACSAYVWNGEAEAGVCRDYKALWSMSLIATVSTFAALALDLHTWKKSNRRGAYVLPEDDKSSQRLRDLNLKPTPRGTSEGYEAPRQQGVTPQSRGLVWDGEHTELGGEDIGYHSRYGAEAEADEEVYSDALIGERTRGVA
ncbi:hypothetical protein G7Y89_g8472 [Cudoniella acicularis]|uniref:MARVEL domain-containing protein n=1 Tax=Cudoniella acicularis TaxID=354080 RepID=A0A8H4RI34_9HELO|nr:hypothetical protein G7Y89_g8472 [Cudoniella acicularis]